MAEESKAEETEPLISDEDGDNVSYMTAASSKPVEEPVENPDEEPDDNKRTTKKGIKLTAKSTVAVELRVHRSMLMHFLAAEHFESRQFWFFEVNQGLLTMVSSILAFVATTELIEERMKIILTTIVGSATIVVGFFQAMNGHCGYGTRAVMHKAVALDLRDLRNNVRLLRLKLNLVEHVLGDETNLIVEDEESTDEDHGKIGDTFESIQDKVAQSLFGCKSTVPIQINEAFDGMNSSDKAAMSLMNGKHVLGIYGPHYSYGFLSFKAFDVLTTEISEYFLFPLFLPHASHVVRKSIDRYHKELERDQTRYLNKDEKSQ